MATILRVKRRNEDEPLEALVFSCKRRKLEDQADATDLDTSATVVKFAGTVQNQDDEIEEHVTKALIKDKLKNNFKSHSVDLKEKARLQVKVDAKERRYKVVNCYRSIDSLNIKELDNKGMTVIDVEDSESCSDKPSSNDQDENYVYDLYYTQTEQNINSDDLFSIRPYDQELHFDDYRSGKSDPEDVDSDSNSESHWKNDYPDSDHSNDESIDEDDIRQAVQRIKLDDEDSDLSSENSDFAYTVDEADVDNYGYKYAKYKAKMLREDDDDDEDEDEDEDEDDAYAIDSDNYDSESSGVKITELASDED